MRAARICYKGEEAGRLIQHDDGRYTYQYDERWMADQSKPPISLTLPKTQQAYHADTLFPFFYHLLPEGTNRQVVSNDLRIDANDHFGLLLATARYDTIGAVVVVPLPEDE